jgi:hypothetical protein
MPLSQGKITAHIAEWEAKLRPTLYSHRRHWPSRLFRHEPLENIVKILGAGQLLSRHDASVADEIANDIVPEEILVSNPGAYQHVRLYFRPKTPTQYHIEGIREPCDFFMGKHAAILYMMVFDAERVLTSDGVKFSTGNMQGHPPVYSDDAGFDHLDFSRIYHEGSISADEIDAVKRARCAEVLVESPMSLPPYLQAVICRSSAERQLLLHELGPHFAGRDRIRVFNEAGVFNADFVFVESVDLAKDGIYVQFHPARRGSPTGNVRIELTQQPPGSLHVHWNQDGLEFWKKWHFRYQIPDGTYLIEIFVRDCLAYRAYSVLQSEPF